MTKKVFLDVECYPNYFLICFKCDDKMRSFELTNSSSLEIKKIKTVMENYLTIGFNSSKYDLPMIKLALDGANNETLKEFSNKIIETKGHIWEIMKQYNLFIPKEWNHIDIIEPAPAVKIGLKMYGARMHTSKLQDLPIQHDSILKKEEYEIVKQYCFNDVEITKELYEKIKQRIDLRVKISGIFGIDLRSKSDAQIAENLIKKALQINKYVPRINSDKTYYYKAPKFINFIGNELKNLLYIFQNSGFKCNDLGKLLKNENCPENVLINNVPYSIGIGGLHSIETSQATTINDDEFLVDADVTSFYPSIILNNKYYPHQLGKQFINIYQYFYNARIKAKEQGNNLGSEACKIILNGSFGKFGSKYSALYSPDLLISTTFTGQLSILMLIELVTYKGWFNVISANTDGITIKGLKKDYDKLKRIFSYWENITKFKLEKTYYKAIYHESVNSYIAIKEDGTIKSKGFYANDGLNKNPCVTVCIDAIKEYLSKGVDIIKTITSSRIDITKFLMTRTVEGGALFKDDYLGVVVRWYYSTEGDKIIYRKNGNKVANSDGAMPLMKLPETMIKDIDYQYYINKSYEMLTNLGVQA